MTENQKGKPANITDSLSNRSLTVTTILVSNHRNSHLPVIKLLMKAVEKCCVNYNSDDRHVNGSDNYFATR